MRRRVAPRHIQIEASPNCQLACTSCPTASGAAAAALGAGHLDPLQFEALLAANPGVHEVELSNYGEIFLHPRLADILRIGWERKVALHADNGVNLNFIREDALEALVRYGFRSMTCSIDGASPEVYSQYRVKGNFERVVGHIRRINQLKRKFQTGFPYLRWQFIVFGHNEREITAARKLAGELGMQFYLKMSWDDDISPIRNRELVQVQMGSAAITRSEHYQATGHDYMRGICAQLWRAPVLTWDGRVSGCCRNFWGEFGGNAFTGGLDAAVNSDGMSRARDMLMGLAEGRGDLPCDTCDLFHAMRRDGTWITDREAQGEPAPILCSLVVDPRDSRATHVDFSVLPGHQACAPAVKPETRRMDLARTFGLPWNVASPGPYTVQAVPRRMDPTFRTAPELFPPVTRFVQVAELPIAQEFRIEL